MNTEIKSMMIAGVVISVMFTFALFAFCLSADAREKRNQQKELSK